MSKTLKAIDEIIKDYYEDIEEAQECDKPYIYNRIATLDDIKSILHQEQQDFKKQVELLVSNVNDKPHSFYIGYEQALVDVLSLLDRSNNE